MKCLYDVNHILRLNTGQCSAECNIIPKKNQYLKKNLKVGHMLLPMAKDKYNFTENFLLSVIG